MIITSKLNYYSTLLMSKITTLSQDSTSLYLLLLMLVIYLSAYLVAKKIRPQIATEHLPHQILHKLITPVVALAAIALVNLIAHLVFVTDYAIIEFFSFITCAQIAITTINVLLQHALYQRAYTRSLIKFATIIMWLVSILIFTNTNDDFIGLLESISLHFGKNSQISLWDIIHGLTIIITTLLFAMLINQTLERKINRIKDLDSNLQHILIRTSKIISYTGAILIALPIIGVDITALSVFGGAVGVGIGFGLQKITSNFLSGFIILLDRSIKVGDRLVIDNQSGLVSKITTRYVVMARFDGTEVLIPNETFITTSIQNQSYSNTELRSDITINLAADDNLLATIEQIKSIVNTAPNVITKKTSASITRLIDCGVEVKAYYWVANPSQITETSNFIYAQLAASLNHKILKSTSICQNIKIIKE